MSDAITRIASDRRERQLRSARAARMLPLEFIDELPELEPPIELPDEDEEPLPIVLPEPVVEPVLEFEPVPIVLPEPVVDGLVLLLPDVDDGLVVVPMLPLPGVVVVVVVVVLGVPIVPVPVLPDGVVVVLASDGVVVVLLPGVVVLLPGVVVLLDCAMAAPPAINNEAAAMAVVVLKIEPMVRTPVWLNDKPTGLLKSSQAR